MQHDPLDPLRAGAGRTPGRRRAPVVHDEPAPRSTSSSASSRSRKSARPLDRVVEVAGLARATEADQVRRDPAGPLEEAGSSHRSSSARRAGTATGRPATGRRCGRRRAIRRVRSYARRRSTGGEDNVRARERRATATEPRRTLCLGEALVDLICERPIERARARPTRSSPTSAAWSPTSRSSPPAAGAHGGAGRRAPATTPGAAGCGTGCASEGVDVSWFALVDGCADAAGRGRRVDGGRGADLPDLRRADRRPSSPRWATTSSRRVVDSAALFFSSNTLVGARRARGHDACARAGAGDCGRPVVFDPNLRLHRWRSRAEAAATPRTPACRGRCWSAPTRTRRR